MMKNKNLRNMISDFLRSNMNIPNDNGWCFSDKEIRQYFVWAFALGLNPRKIKKDLIREYNIFFTELQIINIGTGEFNISDIENEINIRNNILKEKIIPGQIPMLAVKIGGKNMTPFSSITED